MNNTEKLTKELSARMFKDGAYIDNTYNVLTYLHIMRTEAIDMQQSRKRALRILTLNIMLFDWNRIHEDRIYG